MRFFIFLIKFLLLAAFFIISNQSLALANADDRQTFFDEYTGWIAKVAGEVGTLTSYVVKVEWMPSDGGIIDSQNLEENTVRYSRPR